MVPLVIVYYHNKIGIRLYGTNVVLFKEDMKKEEWEFLLSRAI